MIINAIVAFSAHNKPNSKQMNANETLSNFFRHNFFFGTKFKQLIDIKQISNALSCDGVISRISIHFDSMS